MLTRGIEIKKQETIYYNADLKALLKDGTVLERIENDQQVVGISSGEGKDMLVGFVIPKKLYGQITTIYLKIPTSYSEN